MPSLRVHQEPHYVRLLSILRQWGAALDASDTGTGKTWVALFLCKALGLVPLVVGPKTARAGWEEAARLVGVDIEFVNYERLRGQRKLRGGILIDEVEIAENPSKEEADLRGLFCAMLARREGKVVFRQKGGWGEAYSLLEEAGVKGAQMMQAGVYKLEAPTPIRQVRTAETEWLEEKPYGKGSFIRWKNDYGCIIFDEVHRCGGPTSLNSKALIAAKRQAQYVLALSATAADDPRQMKALGFALGLHGLSKKAPPSRLDYRSWLMRHGCTPGVFGGFDFAAEDVKQHKAFEKMHREVFPAHGARLRKAEIPGFPKTSIEIKLLTDESGKAVKLCEKLHKANGEGAGLADTIGIRQKLEVLKVPYYVDLAEDYALTSKVVIFVNFTEPLFELYEKLRAKFGNDQVGYISGSQTGDRGYTERTRFLSDFQANKLTALVCNIMAGGESANMHDPTGQVERTALISPCESGRQFKQVTGRVNRDGGAYSQQFLTYFLGTYEATTADRLVRKNFNLDLLNDADFLC